MEKLPNEILEIILNHLSASDIDLINFGRSYNSSKVNNSRIINFILYYFLRRLKIKSRIKLIEHPTETFIRYRIEENHFEVYSNVEFILLVANSSAVLRYHSEP